ncbi:MAG TPA: tetratricopeptide repeat protein [Bacteroidales bacterium]|nr:tetratricopeptide repeat protein [Bacteroidales bacterium]
MKKEPLKRGPKNKEDRRQNQQQEKLPEEKKYATWFGLAVIILLGIIIYSNSFNCSFQLDDFTSIVNNDRVWWLNNTGYWWWWKLTSRPVSTFTFALNYHFHQLDVTYYHIVNLFVHLLNACLVYWLTLLIFSTHALKDYPVSQHKKVLAFFTAVLFVSHPLATQSVTYIVQRQNSLAAMFYLLSLVLYLKARLRDKYAGAHKQKILLFGGSFISAFLAVFSKENAFTLPFAIVIFEIFFLQTKKISINIRNYRFILFVAAFLSFIIIIFLKIPLHIFEPIPPSQGNAQTVTSLNYFFTQFSVITKYIQLLILPINQNIDYNFPLSNNFFELRTILCFLLLLSLAILAIFLFKKHRIFSFGIFWFFLTLTIESSIIPINDVIFEHRTYLPSFGFFLILSTGIYSLLRNKYKYLAISLLVVIIGTNSFLTYERNKVWKSELTLWNDAVIKSPGKARPLNNRGFKYLNLELWDKAIVDFSKAIEINPKWAIPFYNRGVAYEEIGLQDKAIADYTSAIGIYPKYIDAYYNRGVTYGKIEHWDKAIADYSRVIAINPEYAKAYNNRGIAYDKLEMWDKSIADYSRLIELESWNPRSYSNRGSVYLATRQWDKALADFSKAIAVDPKYIKAYNNRGVVYGNLGEWDKAIADFSKALEIDPNCTDAYNNRNIAYRNLNGK